jgi:antitoxin component YwqK of YwqJK toxin-antitoxin module
MTHEEGKHTQKIILAILAILVFSSCAVTLNGQRYSIHEAEEEYHRLSLENEHIWNEVFGKEYSLKQMEKDLRDTIAKLEEITASLNQITRDRNYLEEENERLSADLIKTQGILDSVESELKAEKGYMTIDEDSLPIKVITNAVSSELSVDSVLTHVCASYEGKVSVDRYYGYLESYCKNGKIDGPEKWYYENGNLRGESTYRVGRLEGPKKWYYENGNLWGESTYKEGKIEGSYKEYYENGNLRIESTYKEGKIEGSYKEYYENGNLRIESTYKEGKIEGSYKKYYENGNLWFKSTYKNGKRHGSHLVFNEYSGELDWEIPFSNGKIGDNTVTEYVNFGRVLHKSSLNNEGVCVSTQKGILEQGVTGITKRQIVDLTPFFSKKFNKWIVTYIGTPQNDITKCIEHYSER